MTIARHRNKPSDYVRSAELRHESSPVERKLWFALRQQRGLKFRRQHPLHPYFADFACLKLKLVIEVDGPSHDLTPDYDKRRDAYMQKLGYTVMRFSNEDVLKDIGRVVEAIFLKAKELGETKPISPLPLTKKSCGMVLP